MNEDSSYSKYLLSKTKMKESEVKNNTSFSVNDLSMTNEICLGDNAGTKLKCHIPKSRTNDFFKLLNQTEIFRKRVACFHIESCGNKQYNSSKNLTEIFFNLESHLNIQQLDFIRIDLAMSIEIPSSFSETENGKCLMINGNFFSNLNIEQNTILSSIGMKNFNKSLIGVYNRKLGLIKEGIERINVYSCLIPEFFSRRIRTSNSCQFTSRIIYETMISLEKEMNSRKEMKIVSDLRKSASLFKRPPSKDHSFRIELNCNLFLALSIFSEPYEGVKRGEKYYIETESLYSFMRKFALMLLSFSVTKPKKTTEFISLMLLEIFFLEFYIKGTQNLHLVSNVKSLKIFSKSLIISSGIPLHDPHAVLNEMISISENLKQNEILRKCVKYSKNIPDAQKEKVFNFLNFITTKNFHKIFDVFLSEYCAALRTIPTKKKTIEIVKISPLEFSLGLINHKRYLIKKKILCFIILFHG